MHTPGPWITQQIKPHKYAIDPHLITSGSMHVCEVDGANDARLIAAAPELLAACEDAIRLLDEHRMLGLTYDTLDEAIKKARGHADRDRF